MGAGVFLSGGHVAASIRVVGGAGRQSPFAKVRAWALEFMRRTESAKPSGSVFSIKDRIEGSQVNRPG